MLEIWKDIPEYEALYEVSDLGRIKNADGIIIIDIKEYSRKANYVTCILKKDGYKKTHSVHKLVLLAFVPNPENKPQGNHINHVKNDNRLVNLEWVTNGENIRAAVIFYKANPTLKPSYIRHQECIANFGKKAEIIKRKYYSDYTYKYESKDLYINPQIPARCRCEDW